MRFGPRQAHFTFWPVFSALLYGVVGDGSIASLVNFNLSEIERPEKVLSFPPGTNQAGSYAVLVQPQNSRWKISLLLLNMTCAGDDHISITSGSIVRTWCMNGTLSTFGNDTEVLVDGNSKYYISVNGGWDQSHATVLATLYQDPQDQCQCGDNKFCCKNECLSVLYRDHAPLKLASSSLAWSSKASSILKNATYPFAGSGNRCIPDILRCNGHPNCGLSCGGDYPDEDESFCRGTPSEDGSSKGISFDKIMVYVIAVVGGGFGISFIIIFFAVYIRYRSKDWGVKQETFVSRSSLDFIHIDIGTNAYEFHPSTLAAIRTHRASLPKVLGFEHT